VKVQKEREGGGRRKGWESNFGGVSGESDPAIELRKQFSYLPPLQRRIHLPRFGADKPKSFPFAKKIELKQLWVDPQPIKGNVPPEIRGKLMIRCGWFITPYSRESPGRETRGA